MGLASQLGTMQAITRSETEFLGDYDETRFLSARHAHSSIGRKRRLCSI